MAFSSRNPWTIVGELLQIAGNAATSLIGMFEEGKSPVYISRYRRDVIGDDVSSEEVREAYHTWNDLEDVIEEKQRLIDEVKQVRKTVPDACVRDLNCAKTIEQLHVNYEPYRPGGPKEIAHIGREHGLDDAAHELFSGVDVNLEWLVEDDVEEMETEKKTASCLAHVLADDIYESKRVQQMLKNV